jgi:hypothetical protein
MLELNDLFRDKLNTMWGNERVFQRRIRKYTPAGRALASEHMLRRTCAAVAHPLKIAQPQENRHQW